MVNDVFELHTRFRELKWSTELEITEFLQLNSIFVIFKFWKKNACGQCSFENRQILGPIGFAFWTRCRVTFGDINAILLSNHIFFWHHVFEKLFGKIFKVFKLTLSTSALLRIFNFFTFFYVVFMFFNVFFTFFYIDLRFSYFFMIFHDFSGFFIIVHVFVIIF